VEKISKRLMNWASILESKTREQAEMTASMPFIFPHVALMPDAHLGKGSTVGSVIPTLGAIIPAAVGVDIGCGMAAVRTQFHRSDLLARGPLSPLREQIERAIPAVRRPVQQEGGRDGGAPHRGAVEDRRRGRVRPGCLRRELAAAAGHPRLG